MGALPITRSSRTARPKARACPIAGLMRIPKFHSRETHLRATRADQDFHALRNVQVEENDPDQPVAIWHVACQ